MSCRTQYNCQSPLTMCDPSSDIQFGACITKAALSTV